MRRTLNIEQRTYTIFDAARIPFACAPGSAFFYGFFDLANAAFIPIQTLLVARFIDSAVAALQGGPTAPVYTSLIFVVLIASFRQLKLALRNFADLKLVLALKERFRMAIVDKQTRLAFHHLENGDTHDLIRRIAKNPEGSHLKQAYFHLFDLASFVIRVGGLLIILSSAVWWGALLVVGISSLTLITGVRGGRRHYEAERRISESDRKRDYFTRILTGRDAAPERDLFGFTNRLRPKWRGAVDHAIEVRLKERIGWYIRAYSGSAVSIFSWVFIMLILLHPLKSGAITVGLFISLTQGFTNLDIVWGFMQTVYGIASDREYFRDLTEFANLDEIREAQSPVSRDAIPRTPEPSVSFEFDDVWFKYPGTETWILKGLNYRFDPGKHYALVGANGAGKTTITRLLTGLYEQNRGRIRLNGRDIREYDSAELMGFFSIVYQDFSRYQVSLRENIVLGRDTPLADSSMDSPEWRELLSVTGVDETARDLSRGIDSHIGKLFDDGVDLSGGQWQRVAMARALAAPAPVRIFDELTAALDPVAESELYELFDHISKDVTTLFISHRLGSTKIADEILVLENGVITEAGGHEALIESRGSYAEMFEGQRRWYERA